MSDNSLNATESGYFQQSSPEAIFNALSSLKPYLESGRFLGQNNPYYHDAASKVKDKFSNADVVLHDEELIQYLAASIMVHNCEGWSYLSQAMQSLVRGDTGAAKHMSYYAELRASLSILASQGIGVFNGRNLVVDSSSGIRCFSRKPTHQIAWQALEEWSKGPLSGKLFGEEIVAFGIPLKDWMGEFLGAESLNYTGANFISMWGVDLDKFSRDRTSRNEVSYQVNLSHNEKMLEPEEFFGFVSDMWIASNPEEAAFRKLDGYLLRSVLRKSYSDKKPVFGTRSYTQVVEELCHVLDVPSYVEGFMKDTAEAEFSILAYAKSSRGTFEDYQFLDMLSRAFLLLRLSSASLLNALSKSGVAAGDVQFWWNSKAYSSGIATLDSLSEDPGEDVQEFWYEVDDAISELSGLDFGKCWKTFQVENYKNFEPLSRLEKIAWFGMARA